VHLAWFVLDVVDQLDLAVFYPLGMPGRVAALVTLKPVWCAIGRSTCFPAPGADSRRLLDEKQMGTVWTA
jgi:hypothetical protein